MPHLISLCIAVIQFLFYVILSSLIQYHYYFKQKETYATWKTQPHRLRSISNVTQEKGKESCSSFWAEWFYPTKYLFFPLLPRVESQHPLQPLLTTFNLLMSAFFAGVVCDQVVTGNSRVTLYPNILPSMSVYSSSPSDYGLLSLLCCFLCSVLLQCVLEYYWHRMQHLPWFYRHLHKLHHYYVSPQPFDDLMIHPVEAFGYYCILYSPAFLIPQPLLSFLLYMIVMGFCGVLDHCGVIVCIPGLYDTREHDAHHQLFNVNYSFPFPFMDQIHGTYQTAHIQQVKTKKEET